MKQRSRKDGRKCSRVVVMLAISILLMLTTCSISGFALEETISSDTVGFTVTGTTVTIDASWEVSLQSEVEAGLDEMTLADIKTLNITAGTLTDVDIAWITGSLPGLEVLNISGEATFESEPLPNGAFSSMDNLSKATIDVDGSVKFGATAFARCNALSEVSLPSTTEFGTSAFARCNALSEVSLPSATEFGNGAFVECGGLVKVSLPEATTFGDEAFFGCTVLNDISLPEATTFGDCAFGMCDGLVEVSLPKAAKFGATAFALCNALSDISLPSATTFGDEALYGCTQSIALKLGTAPPSVADGFAEYKPAEGVVPKLVVPEGAEARYEMASDSDEEGYWYKFKIQVDGESLVTEGISLEVSESDTLYETGLNGSLAESLESKLAKIDGKVVSDITLLKITSGILNSEDVMWITDNLTGLENLEISGEADFDLIDDTFPDSAFSGAGSNKKLEEVKIDINDDRELKFGDGSFDDNFNLMKISLPEAIAFGDGSFEGCRSLISVDLPKTRTLSGAVFLDCEKLEEIALPQVTMLDRGTFKGCNNLRETSFTKVKTIGSYVFLGCRSLEKVSFPEVEKIGSFAFLGCESLQEIRIPKVEEIDEGLFAGINTEEEEIPCLSQAITLVLGENPPAVADGFEGYKPGEDVIPKLVIPEGAEAEYERAFDSDKEGYWYKFKIEYDKSDDGSDDSDDSDDESEDRSDDHSRRNDHSDKVSFEVDGEAKNDFAQAKRESRNGHEITIISIDEKKLEDKLEQAEKGVKFSLAVEKEKGKVVGELNGKIVKDMEFKEAVLDIRTSIAEYILPAEEIHIDRVSEQFGDKVDLEDIKIHMEIGEPEEEMVKVVEDTANEGHFTLLISPVDFTLTCTDGDRVVEVKEFKDYVERIIAIPEGEDPKKITTGLIIYPDGTTCHVPTKVIENEGRYYAKINSLTNSTYSLIWNPKDYNDVKGHWAEEVCNEMGARKIVAETTEDTFGPDANVSRGMFAQTVVRALGLGKKGENQSFHDIESSEYYFGDIATALEFELVSGYEDNTFRAQKDVTREEAAAFMVRAMKIAGLKVDFTEAELEAELEKFIDESQISDWAREVVGICVKNGMLAGNEALELRSKESMTKAQLASMVDRMLRSAELI